MKLQNKILLFFLPTIFIAIAVFGFWASNSSENELRNTVSRYLQGVLTTYVSENMQAQYDLLVRNGLDTIPSYVKRYQQNTLTGLSKVQLIWPGHFFVLSKDGALITSTLKHDPQTMLQSWYHLIQSFSEEKKGFKVQTGYHQFEGKEEFFCITYFKPWHWYIGVAVDASSISASALRIRFGTLLFVLSIGVFISLISLFVLKRILLQPINHITVATRKITNGSYPGHIDVSSNDELAELAKDVMQMSARIEEKTSELINLNRLLEQKVAARTAELTEKNKLLSLEIVERSRIEDMLIQKTRELERSNRNLQDFAYVASHDLQEPLRMVSSFTKLLADRYSDALDEKAKQYVWYAVDGANRMQNLIRDLLEFSHINTQREKFTIIDSSVAVRQAAENLQTAINESQATISYHELPEVIGDAGQLRQVFQNIISNAIKFRGENPPNIKIYAERQKDSWLFSISDNGIGIEAKYCEQIFTIFKRLHTQAEYAGTGLGLAICKRIIERQEGDIWATSEPGKGTTFYFTLKNP